MKQMLYVACSLALIASAVPAQCRRSAGAANRRIPRNAFRRGDDRGSGRLAVQEWTPRGEALDSILFSPRDDEMRNKAIFSLSQFNDERARQALRRVVEDERLPEDIRGEAVFWLGNTPSTANLDYFKTLFRKTRSEELRSKIVQAVSNTPGSEATSWLLDIAKDKSFDTETRKNAIFWVSQRRAFDFDQLSNIYEQANGDDEIQTQVLFVYSQRRQPAAVDKLMAVARSDPSIEMKKQALFWLGQKNDPRVLRAVTAARRCRPEQADRHRAARTGSRATKALDVLAWPEQGSKGYDLLARRPDALTHEAPPCIESSSFPFCSRLPSLG